LSWERLLTIGRRQGSLSSPFSSLSLPRPSPPFPFSGTAMDAFLASFDVGQRAAWASFLANTNVGIVDPAGCGKSQVLLPCIADARRRFGDEAVLVMAWT